MCISNNIKRAFLAASVIALGLTGTAAYADQGTYLSSDAIQITKLLAPPPSANSTAQKQDLQAVLDVQRNRTKADVADAIADVEKSVFRFSDVLGPQFNSENLPKLSALFDAVNNDGEMIAKVAKAHFQRARPYIASSDVHPTVPEHESGFYRSYPSGHGTMGYLDAILLANVVPEKSEELYARGARFGENRVVDGVHYPTDIEASRITATLVASALMENKKFESDFDAARSELRTVLGLK